MIIDGGYGNNSSFLKELEEKKLKYMGRVAKIRKVITKVEEAEVEIRLDEIAKALLSDNTDQIELKLSKNKLVWVKTFKARISVNLLSYMLLNSSKTVANLPFPLR